MAASAITLRQFLLEIILISCLRHAFSRSVPPGKKQYQAPLPLPYPILGHSPLHTGYYNSQIPPGYQPFPPAGTFYDSKRNILRSFPGGGVPVLADYQRRCPSNFVGVKPHPKQRQYYYVCKADCVIFGKCQNLQFFDATKGQCSPCPTPAYTPVCTVPGRFAILTDCSIYYKCDAQLKPRIYSCPLNTIFSPHEGKCVCGGQGSPTEVSATDSHIPQDCEHKFPPCMLDGTFRAPTDCSLYYTCAKQTNGIFLQKRFKCPELTLFDTNQRVCRPQHEVACDSIQLSELVYPKPPFLSNLPLLYPAYYSVDSLEDSEYPIEYSLSCSKEDTYSSSVRPIDGSYNATTKSYPQTAGETSVPTTTSTYPASPTTPAATSTIPTAYHASSTMSSIPTGPSTTTDSSSSTHTIPDTLHSSTSQTVSRTSFISSTTVQSSTVSSSTAASMAEHSSSPTMTSSLPSSSTITLQTTDATSSISSTETSPIASPLKSSPITTATSQPTTSSIPTDHSTSQSTRAPILTTTMSTSPAEETTLQTAHITSTLSSTLPPTSSPATTSSPTASPTPTLPTTDSSSSILFSTTPTQITTLSTHHSEATTLFTSSVEISSTTPAISTISTLPTTSSSSSTSSTISYPYSAYKKSAISETPNTPHTITKTLHPSEIRSIKSIISTGSHTLAHLFDNTDNIDLPSDEFRNGQPKTENTLKNRAEHEARTHNKKIIPNTQKGDENKTLNKSNIISAPRSAHTTVSKNAIKVLKSSIEYLDTEGNSGVSAESLDNKNSPDIRFYDKYMGYNEVLPSVQRARQSPVLINPPTALNDFAPNSQTIQLDEPINNFELHDKAVESTESPELKFKTGMPSHNRGSLSTLNTSSPIKPITASLFTQTLGGINEAFEIPLQSHALKVPACKKSFDKHEKNIIASSAKEDRKGSMNLSYLETFIEKKVVDHLDTTTEKNSGSTNVEDLLNSATEVNKKEISNNATNKKDSERTLCGKSNTVKSFEDAAGSIIETHDDSEEQTTSTMRAVEDGTTTAFPAIAVLNPPTNCMNSISMWRSFKATEPTTFKYASHSANLIDDTFKDLNEIKGSDECQISTIAFREEIKLQSTEKEVDLSEGATNILNTETTNEGGLMDISHSLPKEPVSTTDSLNSMSSLHQIRVIKPSTANPWGGASNGNGENFEDAHDTQITIDTHIGEAHDEHENFANLHLPSSTVAILNWKEMDHTRNSKEMLSGENDRSTVDGPQEGKTMEGIGSPTVALNNSHFIELSRSLIRANQTTFSPFRNTIEAGGSLVKENETSKPIDLGIFATTKTVQIDDDAEKSINVGSKNRNTLNHGFNRAFSMRPSASQEVIPTATDQKSIKNDFLDNVTTKPTLTFSQNRPEEQFEGILGILQLSTTDAPSPDFTPTPTQTVALNNSEGSPLLQTDNEFITTDSTTATSSNTSKTLSNDTRSTIAPNTIITTLTPATTQYEASATTSEPLETTTAHTTQLDIHIQDNSVGIESNDFRVARNALQYSSTNTMVANLNSENVTGYPADAIDIPKLEIAIFGNLDLTVLFCPKDCTEIHKHKYDKSVLGEQHVVGIQWDPVKSNKTMSLRTV